MSMQSTQVQLRVSLPEELNELLQAKAARFGVRVTQFVKYLIIKDVENEVYPTHQASEWLEEKTKKAMETIDRAVGVKDVHKFFKNL